jgi:hypothetical protein
VKSPQTSVDIARKSEAVEDPKETGENKKIYDPKPTKKK